MEAPGTCETAFPVCKTVWYILGDCCELISAACNVLVSLLLYTFVLNTLK